MFYVFIGRNENIIGRNDVSHNKQPTNVHYFLPYRLCHTLNKNIHRSSKTQQYLQDMSYASTWQDGWLMVYNLNIMIREMKYNNCTIFNINMI